MAKALTYEEFIEYAQKYYDKGGDGYVECWGEKEFNCYVSNFGPITYSVALEMFRVDYEIEKEAAAQAANGWW